MPALVSNDYILEPGPAGAQYPDRKHQDIVEVPLLLSFNACVCGCARESEKEERAPIYI